ncbi:MAG: FKBP12-associated protein [Ramalina farinacea]|uniref:FKBP12-associated protein n=1 Tax=Ramalina farinacea TaxID=258253 RepID=A0AA43QX35_9LECA|nr:FKBP12-associated protein [Ramalina farinacea]
MLITCECQNIKQEIKCNASKNSEGNSKKSLGCDEECGRLARNQRLAQALNIDPDSHKDDHLPYSNETLKMYRESSKWAQIQEREFRVFAADEDEKRLRFKPMPSSQRAFLHSLATDFGFDSESMDPEPHRHVCIFKTPRFLLPPMKTLGECVRIRNTEAEAAAVAVQEPVRRLVANNEPYNGFLLSSPRFGLTLDELHHEYSSSFTSTPGLAYDIAFLPQEEIVIKARPAATSTIISSASIEASLKSIKSSISTATSSKKIAAIVQLCSLDASLNIIRREADEAASNDGWSRVAAKGAMPRTLRPYAGVGQKSQYTVLALNSKKKKEETKKVLADVVDDWEDEMKRQEDLATNGNELMEEEFPANAENDDTAIEQQAE